MIRNQAISLENDNILLRAVEPEDLEILYQWENDPEIWTVSNTLIPLSRYVLKRYIEESHLDIFQTKQVRFMIDRKPLEGEKDNIVIGTIDLFDFDPQHLRAGIGILIREQENRRKGYARQALDIIIDYCFSILLLHQVYCNIPAYNMASINLFKDRGFIETGRKKEWLRTPEGWVDEIIFQLVSTYSANNA